MVNAALIELLREAWRHHSTPVFIKRKDGSFTRKNDVVTLSSKRGNETLIAVALHGFFDANGSATEVAGAVPSDSIDDITIKVDKQLKMKADNMVAMREMMQILLGKDWEEDTLATDPSSATYDFWAIIFVSGRNSNRVEIIIDMAAQSLLYDANVLTNLKTEYFGIYSPIEVPEFSIITKSKDFTSTGVDDIELNSDFANGFLEELLIMGDGTVVIDDVELGDSNSTELASIKFTELQRFTRLRFPLRNIDSDSAMVRLNSKKPLDSDDKLHLDIDTIGEVYIGGLFKNESTEVTPESDKAKTPTPNRTEVGARTQPALGEQPELITEGVTEGGAPMEVFETSPQQTGGKTVKSMIKDTFGL